MARTRVDAHRPKEMVPANYRLLASSYGFTVDDPVAGTYTEIEWDGNEEWEALGQPTESTCDHAVKGQCDHCGARHTYQSILLYVPTNEILSVGHVCAAERFGNPNFKNVIADGARRAELKAKRDKKEQQAISQMDDATLIAYQWARDEDTAHRIAKDIASKVPHYGPLSVKQSAFLVKLHQEAFEKKEQIEAGEIEPCPSGRVTITGKVVKIKEVEAFRQSRWGGTSYDYKMIVKDDRGFAVYGSVPSSLGCVDELVGKRVEFSGQVEPSNNDATFGFFSRPTKAQLIEA